MSSNFPVRLTKLYGKYYVTVIRRTAGTLDSYKIQPEEIESALTSLQAVYRPGSEFPGQEVEVTEPVEILARLDFNSEQGIQIEVDPNQLRGLKEELTKMHTTAQQLVERYLSGGTAYREGTLSYDDLLNEDGDFLWEKLTPGTIVSDWINPFMDQVEVKVISLDLQKKIVVVQNTATGEKYELDELGQAEV